MKVETSKKYIAFDGTPFNSKEECNTHENENFLKQFANWKPERVLAADTCDTDKGKRDANAVEAWASKLRERRLERGDLKKKGTKKPPATPPAEGAGAPAA